MEEPMSLPLDQLEAEALELPVGDRARLATRLLESLDDEAEEDPADVEEAWLNEAERRYQRYLAGETVARPAEEVFARIRERRQSP
jgi:putative addiction module component (TIGR02574 family)